MRRRDDGLPRIPYGSSVRSIAAKIFDDSAKSDRILFFRPRQLPRVSSAQPGLRTFLLPSFPQVLLEETVLVPDPITVTGHPKGGHAVEITGSEPAEAPVTQCGI